MRIWIRIRKHWSMREKVIRKSEAGVLVRNSSQLTPLSQAKRANPSYFTMLCVISSELAGCVHRPIVDSESTIAG